MNNRGAFAIVALLIFTGIQVIVIKGAEILDHKVLNKENYRTMNHTNKHGIDKWEDKVKLNIDPKAENKGFVYTDVRKAQEAGYIDASGVQRI